MLIPNGRKESDSLSLLTRPEPLDRACGEVLGMNPRVAVIHPRVPEETLR